MQLAFTIRSISDPFVITDVRGPLYEVKTVPDTAERLSLRAAGGGELAAVVRDGVSGGFEVLIDGTRAALVRTRGMIRRQYLIDKAGDTLSVLGNVYGGTYSLTPGADIAGPPQVVVSRSRIGAGDDLRVTVADGEDPVPLIAVVLGIEYLNDDRRAAIGELAAARVLLRMVRPLGN